MPVSTATTNAQLTRYKKPRAINAGTTYGVDTTVGNNYGLGANYVSPRVAKNQTRAQSAEPSAWWLAAFLIFLAVV